MAHRKSLSYSPILVQIHFIQHMQFNQTNVTLYIFQKISGLKIFPECFPRATKNALAGHMWPACR